MHVCIRTIDPLCCTPETNTKLTVNQHCKYICKYPSGFPGGSVVKNPPANAGDTGGVGSIPGLGIAPGEGNGKPLSILALRTPWTV